MMRRLLLLAAMCAALAGVGCRHGLNPFEYDRVVAEVEGERLRASDVRAATTGATGSDSVALARVFVDHWVMRRLKLIDAHEVLRGAEQDIEAQVAEYRAQLLTRRLDQFYVDQQIDTLFTDAQIEAYHTTHAREFALDRTIVKGRVVRVPLNYRQKSLLKQLTGATTEERLRDWRDICRKNEFEMHEFTAWTDFTELLGALPTRRDKDHSGLLLPGVLQEMRDADGIYYFVVTALRRTGEPAPLERVRESIRRILFRERQQEVIRRNEERMLRAALDKGVLRLNTNE